MAGSLSADLLHEIFNYIRDSKPTIRRPGYTYELHPDVEDKGGERYDAICGGSVQYPFQPVYALRPLLLVCKSWEEIAKGKLMLVLDLAHITPICMVH